MRISLCVVYSRSTNGPQTNESTHLRVGLHLKSSILVRKKRRDKDTEDCKRYLTQIFLGNSGHRLSVISARWASRAQKASRMSSQVKRPSPEASKSRESMVNRGERERGVTRCSEEESRLNVAITRRTVTRDETG